MEQLLNQNSPETLAEDLKKRYLGKQGEVVLLLKQIASVDQNDRAEFGQKVNDLKSYIQSAIDVQVAGNHDNDDVPDHTMPGRRFPQGSLHPLTLTVNRICRVFKDLGFRTVTGPDVETDHYNFTALNFPPDHPAKDMHDTFYFDAHRLLRTHTSPVQIRALEKMSLPVRIIAPGKVYRCDSDVTHSPMFHQIEGLYVGENVSFGHLKHVLALFAKIMFGEHTRTRFRPSFFPFTEPSAEIDVTCVMCQGNGCRTCGQSGWLEILGAGMVDPNVLKFLNIDTEKYQGYAFGLGVERIAMLQYGIADIRLLYENHLAFLTQFKI